jgi:hypothetical protein
MSDEGKHEAFWRNILMSVALGITGATVVRADQEPNSVKWHQSNIALLTAKVVQASVMEAMDLDEDPKSDEGKARRIKIKADLSKVQTIMQSFNVL